jgi:acyloxyacyl hydrolase
MRSLLVVVLLVIVALVGVAPYRAQADANGGSKCAVCTLLVALVEQNMQIKQINASASMEMICSYLPSPLNDACAVALLDIGAKVTPFIDAGENPDAVCASLGMCFNQTGVCRLFPSNMTETEHVQRVMEMRAVIGPVRAFNICTIVPGVCDMENHEPFSDTDGDKFSTIETLRGSFFRGKDCDDLNNTIFPGRNSHDAVFDENCNGIYGVDALTGQTYEDKWCAGTNAFGIAALGDSATAHFRLPPNYLVAANLSSANFAHILRLLENEADWPMLSWSTGHLNSSEFNPDIYGPVSSLYSRMLEHNRCNHRDYQNLGVNGARVSDLLNFDTELARNKKDNVKPLVMIYSMVGNDVCNGHHTFNTMTTPTEYYNNIMAALEKAENFLPTGSHVILIPLVDGRILFETMRDRIHPIGSTNNDVTYTALYDYLNCVDISPCWGWMNSNETVRNTTFEIASSLNAQLPLIVNASSKFKNFDVHYFGNIFNDAIKTYPYPMYTLIEPVDGFHPSQWGNSWIGDYLFNVTLASGILGAPNPNNAAITAKFGDQGGY